jgi:endonuclease YncB( thermonuclease family)
VRALPILAAFVLGLAVADYGLPLLNESAPALNSPAPLKIVWHCDRVIDGDTFVATRSDRPNEPEHVRLYGIDAPEHNLPGGAEATAKLRSLIEGKIVAIDWAKRDKYGRLLGNVTVGGVNCSDALLAAHLAVPYFGGHRDSDTVSATVEKDLAGK